MEYNVCNAEVLLGILPLPIYALPLIDEEHDRWELKLGSAEYRYLLNSTFKNIDKKRQKSLLCLLFK